MQDLKITLVQANQVWEDKKENYTNYSSLLRSVETDLIVLPEMFNTAFSMNVDELAEDWQDSSSIKWLKDLSKAKNAAVFTSLIIKDNNKFHNRGVFILPTGEINYYDKRKSFGLANEDRLFTAGKNEVIVSYKNWKINLQICYDLRFPELIRNRIEVEVAAYDLLLYVANWPEKRINHWDALLLSRAIENQCYVVGVNRVGRDFDGLDYCGHSKLIGPLGEVDQLTSGKEISKTVVIVKSSLNSTRNKLPFLKDRT